MTILSLRRHSRGLGLRPRRRRAPGAVPSYAATPVNFNGSTHLARGGPLTGVADSKVWSGSVWFRRDPADAFVKIFAGASQRHDLMWFGSGLNEWVLLFGANSSGAEIVRLTLVSNDTDWHHLQWSFDLADSEARYAYFDGVEAGTWTTYTDDAIDFTDTDFFLGSNAGGANTWEGDLADIWMRFGGDVIDLSVEANRRMFITAEGTPANPAGWPSDGQVQLYGPVDDWHSNKGSAGGFTVNGVLADGTGPVQLP
jgi:hypothetical protein